MSEESLPGVVLVTGSGRPWGPTGDHTGPVFFEGGSTGHLTGPFFFVYYESIKRELNKRLIFECRCDARLKAKDEGSTRLTYTRCREEPLYLKTKTRLINEQFASVMGECVIWTPQVLRRHVG